MIYAKIFLLLSAELSLSAETDTGIYVYFKYKT